MDRNENWEHLVLHMQGSSANAQVSLVFSDFRMFGRVLFHAGDTLPPWWTSIAPAIGSSEFTIQNVAEFMKRRSGITVKAALLMQERFPGIGNWMADEILWRACIHPSRRCGDLSDDEVVDLHSVCVWVCKQAMAIIGSSFADPPSTWLYHYRWQDGGKCPLTGSPLQRETIGGRTSCFCPSRQKMKGGGRKDVFIADAPSGSPALVKSSSWKAQASSSSKTTTGMAEVTSIKHGKKRDRSAPANVKVEAENVSPGVSPWGRLVRTRGATTVGAKVKSEDRETLQTRKKRIKVEGNSTSEAAGTSANDEGFKNPRTRSTRIKVEENPTSEAAGQKVKDKGQENQPTRQKRMKVEDTVQKESTLPLQTKSLLQKQQRLARAPTVQLQTSALTERQQVIKVTRLQQQMQPCKDARSNRLRS